jgi:hypothetical protein
LGYRQAKVGNSIMRALGVTNPQFVKPFLYLERGLRWRRLALIGHFPSADKVVARLSYQALPAFGGISNALSATSCARLHRRIGPPAD